MKVPLPHEIALIPSAGKSGREQLLRQCHDIRIDVFRREMGSSVEDEVDKFVVFLFRSVLQTTQSRSKGIKRYSYFLSFIV